METEDGEVRTRAETRLKLGSAFDLKTAPGDADHWTEVTEVKRQALAALCEALDSRGLHYDDGDVVQTVVEGAEGRHRLVLTWRRRLPEGEGEVVG